MVYGVSRHGIRLNDQNESHGLPQSPSKDQHSNRIHVTSEEQPTQQHIEGEKVRIVVGRR